jgi:hypothetical protein
MKETKCYPDEDKDMLQDGGKPWSGLVKRTENLF